MSRAIDADHGCQLIAACGAENLATGKRIKEVAQGYSAFAVMVGYAKGIDDALAVLSSMPAIDTVKHGKWINAYPEIEPNPMFMYGICSECGCKQSISSKLKYCFDCGAKMDGGE